MPAPRRHGVPTGRPHRLLLDVFQTALCRPAPRHRRNAGAPYELGDRHHAVGRVHDALRAHVQPQQRRHVGCRGQQLRRLGQVDRGGRAGV